VDRGALGARIVELRNQKGSNRRRCMRKPERISPDEYERITQLSSQARRLMEAAVDLTTRLRPALRETSPRGQVRSRLECVQQDFLSPLVRDLNRIAETAGRGLEDDEGKGA
jgi:hypothetical protein